MDPTYVTLHNSLLWRLPIQVIVEGGPYAGMYAV